MTDGQYPDRAELIGAMLPVLKAARRSLPPEWEPFGLDRDGWNDLDRLVGRLIRHTSFEHLKRQDIRTALHDAALEYRQTPAGERRSAREVAAGALDAMAQEPMHRTVYLGLAHLSLPDGTTIGAVRSLDLSQDAALAEAFSRFGDKAPTHVCEDQGRRRNGPPASRTRPRSSSRRLRPDPAAEPLRLPSQDLPRPSHLRPQRNLDLARR